MVLWYAKSLLELASEKGASSWLVALPIVEHGFLLHKSAFKDALWLRYGWQPSDLPSECVCGASFTVEHALSCPQGGFRSLRHNEVRDLSAQLLSDVCVDVAIEPTLLPLTGEHMIYSSANTEDGARLDVRARGVWGSCHEVAYFDVRVFNPFATSNRQKPLCKVYHQHEQEKRRVYERRVREVEHGSFTPLVLSATGGMGRASEVTFKRLAFLISSKHQESYSRIMSWLRCTLGFSLLRSAIMCLRGSRHLYNRHRLVSEVDFLRVLSEGKL